MAVRFREVVFRNDNGIEVALTIEAPIDTVAIPSQKIPPESTVTIPVRVDDCLSVRLIASDSTHGAFQQTFAVAPPVDGRRSFLDSLRARYIVGSFEGRFVARTEGGD